MPCILQISWVKLCFFKVQIVARWLVCNVFLSFQNKGKKIRYTQKLYWKKTQKVTIAHSSVSTLVVGWDFTINQACYQYNCLISKYLKNHIEYQIQGLMIEKKWRNGFHIQVEVLVGWCIRTFLKMSTFWNSWLWN